MHFGPIRSPETIARNSVWTEPVKIRIADSNDVAVIAELHAQSWRSAYRGMLDDDYLDRRIFSERETLWAQRFQSPAPNQLVQVAQEDGRVLGFACAYGGDDAQWGTFLDNLHVSPESKRRGIGKALMQQVAVWSLERHPGAGMYLWVLESNSPAIRFYEQLGGVRSGVDKWRPPDGGSYTKFRYFWESLETLIA